MAWSDRIVEIFSIAGAVVASFGGAGALLLWLSNWFGNLWASQILEREKAELTRSIEVTKADLVRSVERDKATLTAFLDEHRSELEQLASERLDALSRRRDIYARLATKMRVLVRADMPPDQRESEKWAFLAAYDEGFLWASEAVVTTVHDLLELLEKKTIADNHFNLLLRQTNSWFVDKQRPSAHDLKAASALAEQLQVDAKGLYQRCLLEMRKDSGFPETQASYRLVSF